MNEKQIRKKYKGRARFRVAPGSDNPYNPAVSRVIIEPKDTTTYEELKAQENMLAEIFDVETVVFR
jgi:hypothetical protein